jgi:hypothetical protein
MPRPSGKIKSSKSKIFKYLKILAFSPTGYAFVFLKKFFYGLQFWVQSEAPKKIKNDFFHFLSIKNNKQKREKKIIYYSSLFY